MALGVIFLVNLLLVCQSTYGNIHLIRIVCQFHGLNTSVLCQMGCQVFRESRSDQQLPWMYRKRLFRFSRMVGYIFCLYIGLKTLLALRLLPEQLLCSLYICFYTKAIGPVKQEISNQSPPSSIIIPFVVYISFLFLL